MYDPTKRLHALYPISRTHPVVPEKKRRRRSTVRSKKTHIALIVCIDSVGGAAATPYERVIHTRAHSKAQATTMAKTFGCDNILLYLQNRYTHGTPILQVGITKGCRTEGMSVTGMWVPVTDIFGTDEIVCEMERLNLTKYSKHKEVFAKKCNSHVVSSFRKNIQIHAHSRIENRFMALAAKIISSSPSLTALVQQE